MPATRELSEELLQLAESDPGACLSRCRELLSSRDQEEVAAAQWASGVALRSLARIDESIEALKLAESTYRQLGLTRLADEAKISLAPSLAISGEFGEAVSLLEPLVGSNDDVVRAHTHVQLAGLVARTGEFDRALALYTEALPLLRKSEDSRWLALLYSNRGLVQTYRGEFASAEHDIRAAMSLFDLMGRESSVAEMLANLGFMYVTSGDVAKGLATLVEAEQRFQLAGLPSEVVSTARAYGYMLAGLPDRAHRVLSLAAESFNRQGRQLEEAEAWIHAGRAALDDGNPAGAIEALDSALRLASTSERVGWEALATLIRARAATERGEAFVPELRSLARRLRDIDNLSGAVDATTLAAESALDEGDIETAALLIGEAMITPASDLELPVAVRLGLVHARQLLAESHDGAAMAELRRTADLIDRNRMMLSATESRAGLSRHSSRVEALGLSRMNAPPDIVEWVERFRGSALRIAPVVPNSNPAVARLLAELRRTVKAREDLAMAGESLASITGEIRAIEARIRDRVLAEPDIPAFRPAPTIGDLQSGLGNETMLYLFERGENICAAHIGEDGVTVREVSGSARIAMVAHHLLSSMRRAFMYPVRADPRRTHEMLDELAGLFFAELPATDQLVVVPPPDLLALPWNALMAKHAPEASLVVSPSGAAWLSAQKTPVKEGPTSVVMGPRLNQAQAEAEAIQKVHGGNTTVLEHEESTVSGALKMIETSAIFHAVAHGHLRRDSPMFSSLEFYDGELSLYHLERLSRSAPIVVLSACDSAHGSVVAGQEIFGLTSVFLERGTRSILSTVAPIPDSAASVAAVREVHAGLRDGLDAPSALKRALDGSSVESVDPALAFVAYGAR